MKKSRSVYVIGHQVSQKDTSTDDALDRSSLYDNPLYNSGDNNNNTDEDSSSKIRGSNEESQEILTKGNLSYIPTTHGTNAGQPHYINVGYRGSKEAEQSNETDELCYSYVKHTHQSSPIPPNS